MEKQMKLFTNMTKPLVLFVLLFALGVGNVWGNYAYLDLDGYRAWYNDDAYFQINFNGTVYKDPVEVNKSGVWRFNINSSSGNCTFQRMKPNTSDQWNYYNGSISATQNVARITGGNAGEMRTTFVINYIHGTNHVYFDNSVSNFTDNIYFVIGHDYSPTGSSNTYSIAYKMTPVTGTKLYHVEISSTWNDAMYYAIIADDAESISATDWGSSSLGNTDKGDKGYTAAHKTVYNMEGGSYLITTASSGNNQAITINYYDGHSNLPKYNATQAAKKRDTGTEYSDVSGDWPATLKLRGSYMTSSTDTARSTITSTTSEDGDGNKTYGAIRSGEVTHTYESLSSSYHFEGWGTGDSPSNTDATYSYNITGNTTTYAFFSKLYTLTYERKGDYDTSTVAVYSVDGYSGSKTSGSSIPTGHLITIVATPATGYEVKGWYSDASCETEYEDGEGGVTIEDHNNTFKLASLNANTGVYPKFGPKTYTINLESMDADDDGTTSVDVTYNASTNMTASDAIDKPTKAHYTFDGYWTSENTGTTLDHQLIDADGKWIADKTGYTSNDGEGNPTWVHNYAISLYAKWDEVPYTITMAVSPAGTGTTSPASTATGKLVTESGNITATPAAGYKFKEWQFSKTDENYDAWCANGYSSTDATIHIKAQHNGTLTAVFEERYSLVGSLQDNSGNGGMPGWEDYSKTFTVNSSSPVDLTRTCTLQAGKTYKVQVHDLATSTNLGRSGCDPVCVLEENASLVMENSNNDVFLYTSGAGEYIFKITAVDGSGHPTLTVLRPYPVNFGQKYQDIDGTLHAGTTGGTAAATAGSALSSGDYVTYNTSVTHTATPESGYSFAGWWSSDAFEGARFSDNNPMTYAVTFGDNAYAKFVETSTSVTLANDGHGHVEIDDVTKSETTCGVTTTRSLTAVPNAGYKFSSWDKSGDDITLSSTSTNPTTLTGLGSGLDEGQTVTANFTERYSIKGTMNGENWVTTHTLTNIGTNAGSKDTCYVTMTLPANTTYEFAIYDEQTGGWYKASTVAVYNMTYTNHTNWEFGDTKTYNCGITTAGKGTYKFIFNITDTTVTVVYPASYQVNYGASVGGSVTSVKDDDNNDVPNGGYVRSGGSITFSAAANTYYTFVGWCNNETYGDPFNTELSWTNNNVTETQNSFAKFKSTNFVIYRTGDMAEDDRAALDDVESYAGGTISEEIEYRMKVRELDKWYSLCLPFDVNAVKVWEDGTYYDLVPFYRPTVGGTFYTGDYIIRTPKQTTDFPIAEFDDWRDPTSPTGYKPVKNTPYIIQWHDSYFSNRYVSFFGTASQEIPDAFSAGDAPSSDNVVNVYGNNSMQSGSVAGAYLLENDYGSNGAWLRLEDASEARTILPFECYIRANTPTTTKYRVLRRDMTIDDTPTGLDQIINRKSYNRKFIKDGQLFIIRDDKMYNVYGMEVQK